MDEKQQKLDLDIADFVDNIKEVEGIINNKTIRVWELQARAISKVVKLLFDSQKEELSRIDIGIKAIEEAENIIPLCSDISKGDFRLLGGKRVIKLVDAFLEVNADFLEICADRMEKIPTQMNFNLNVIDNSTKNTSSEEKPQTPLESPKSEENSQIQEKVATANS